MGVAIRSFNLLASQPFGYLARLAGLFQGADPDPIATGSEQPGFLVARWTMNPLPKGHRGSRGLGELRLRLLGVGAMSSPRDRPAGLLILAPSGAELIAGIRQAARGLGLEPDMSAYDTGGLLVVPRAHTAVRPSHSRR